MAEKKKVQEEFRTYDEYLERFFPQERKRQEVENEDLYAFGENLARESLKRVRSVLTGSTTSKK